MIADQLNDFKRVLEQYSSQYVRPKNTDIDDILNADETTRLGWDDLTLQAKAGTIKQYTNFMQIEINKQLAVKKWSEHNMKVIEGKECSKYGTQYTKYEERLNMLLADNEPYRTLSEIQLQADSRLTSLYGVSEKLLKYSETLIEMAKSKRAVKYER